MKMKTKNILKSLAVVSCCFLLPGCDMDEYNPSGGPTMEQYASTPAGFDELISACYYPLTRSWTGGGEDWVVHIAEVGTDIWTTPRGDSHIKEFFYYDGLGPMLGHMAECWQSSYESINHCNAAIRFAPECSFPTDAARNAKVAEAHYLRAFFNFFLVEQWGGVYLPQTNTTAPNTDMERASVEEMYALILSDLDFATKHLPLVQPANETGRVTRKAAYHLLAKAALQYAVEYTPANKTELLTLAKRSAEEVINNQAAHTVSLYPEVADVFDVANNKSNSEAVWVATHSSVASLNPRGGSYWNRVYKQFGVSLADKTCGINWYTSPGPSGESGEYCSMSGRIMPTLLLLDLYGEKDARYAAYFREDYIANADYVWTSGDASSYFKDNSFVGTKTIKIGELGARFTRESVDNPEAAPYAYLDRDLIYNADGTTNLINAPKGYPALKKFETPFMYGGGANKPWSWGDHILYRLAETYLLAAEAAYWLNDMATAKTYFNVVRNRACEGHDGSLDITEGDIDVDFILAERARELCGEYTRFMDLKRMGKEKMTEYVNSNPNIRAKGMFNYDVHKVRPLPWNTELGFYGNPEAAQNPGY